MPCPATLLYVQLKGRGNASLLLLGPAGCGKTLFLNTALEELRERFSLQQQQSKATSETAASASAAVKPPEPLAFKVIRLSGCLQPDNAAALQEVTLY